MTKLSKKLELAKETDFQVTDAGILSKIEYGRDRERNDLFILLESKSEEDAELLKLHVRRTSYEKCWSRYHGQLFQLSDLDQFIHLIRNLPFFDNEDYITLFSNAYRFFNEDELFLYCLKLIEINFEAAQQTLKLKQSDALIYKIGEYLYKMGAVDNATRILQLLTTSGRYFTQAQMIISQIHEAQKGFDIAWFRRILHVGQELIEQLDGDKVTKLLTENDPEQLDHLLFDRQANFYALLRLANLIMQCSNNDLAYRLYEFIIKASPNTEITTTCHSALVEIDKARGKTDFNPDEQIEYYISCIENYYQSEPEKCQTLILEQMEKQIESGCVLQLVAHILDLSSLSLPEIFYYGGLALAKMGNPALAFCFFQRTPRANGYQDGNENKLYQLAQFEMAKLLPSLYSSMSHVKMIQTTLDICISAGEDYMLPAVKANENLLLGKNLDINRESLLDKIERLEGRISQLEASLNTKGAASSSATPSFWRSAPVETKQNQTGASVMASSP